MKTNLKPMTKEEHKAKHTPGPWFYQENSDAYTHHVRPVSNPGTIICFTSQGTNGVDEANARLIAAAPETKQQRDVLLDALRDCVEPILRYESCLQGYAEESAYKGNRDNKSFWEKRTKEVVGLSRKIKQAIAQAESNNE